MPDLTNPANALSRSTQLLQLLGSFWNESYAGRKLAADYCIGKNYAELQTFQILMEVVASVSRFTVPIYAKKNWVLFTFKRSEQLSGSGYRYQAPANLADCSLIVNRMTASSLTLTKEIDFEVSKDVVVFRKNPFQNSLISKRPIFDSKGNQIDTEAAVWLFYGDFDLQYIYTQFAYSLDLFLESSENYRTLLNAIWDAILVGSTYIDLSLILSVITDTPLVVEPEEMVVGIYDELTRKLVITDYHVYKLAPTANITVAVGQVLRAGDVLTDAWAVYDPSKVSAFPSASQVPAITLDQNLLQGAFSSDVTFSNKLVPINISVDANSRTKIDFELGGLPSDVQLFWDTTHNNGTAMGAISLAQLLDERYPPAQTPDPLGPNLPATVNPLAFLMQNVLRNNALVLTMNTGSFGPNALSFSVPQAFENVINPTTLLFILVKVLVSDSVAASDDSFGNFFESPDPMAESSPDSFVGPDGFIFSSPVG